MVSADADGGPLNISYLADMPFSHALGAYERRAFREVERCMEDFALAEILVLGSAGFLALSIALGYLLKL